MDTIGRPLGKNVVVLGILSHIYGLELPGLEKLIDDRYGSKGEKVVEGNIRALKEGSNAAAKMGVLTVMDLSKVNLPMKIICLYPVTRLLPLGL